MRNININNRMIKSKFLFLVLSVIIVGCQSSKQKQQAGNLPVINISKSYPKKEIRLQDIADIEYVPLETTDDVLLGDLPTLTHVSDKYIIAYNLGEGTIFVFNRNGTIFSYFDRRGQGGEEYIGITAGGIKFDEKNEEIFVLSNQNSRIFVYSVSGEYKRTLQYSSDLAITEAYLFDDETLLVYDDFRPYRDVNSTKPYMLMSKKDGSIVPELAIHLPVRYADRVYIDLGNNMTTSARISTPNRRYFGKDHVIADISSDTIYLLSQNRELNPILVHTPSVHSSDPGMVWTTPFITDKFILLHITALDYIAAEKGAIVPSKTLIYEFETGEISEVSFVDVNRGMRQWIPSFFPATAKNMDARCFQVPNLKAAYEEKLLKGELEKLVATLDEDDNPVVMIVKFK